MPLLKKSSLLAFAPVVGVTIKSEYYRALQVSFSYLSFINEEANEAETKKFDEWKTNAISETQLHGEYGRDDTRDLTWDELDEEDKLMLLERETFQPNKSYFSEE